MSIAGCHPRRKHGLLIATIVALAIPPLWYLLAFPPIPPAATLPYRESPATEQWAVVLAFFGVKLLYTVLCAGLIAKLWQQRAADLVALRRSLIAFFIGEAFCFLNVMLFHDASVLMEHVHSVGMVLSLGFAVWAALEAIDQRILHFSDDRTCAMAGLCRQCSKHSDVPCGLRRLFLATIPMLALIAAMPLFSPLRHTAYATTVLKARHVYQHAIPSQLYELRYLPSLAIVLLGICFIVLWRYERRQVPLSKILFSAALGATAFSFFRMILIASYVDHQVWFAVWEEMLELISIASIVAVLLVFRTSLLQEKTS
jgi:hypothetical protein